MKTKVLIALFIIGLLFIGLTAFAQEKNPTERPQRVIEISAEQTQEQSTAFQQLEQLLNQIERIKQFEQGRTNKPVETENEEELQKKFEEDLAKYGKWVDDEQYGKVWVPNDAQKDDWKPYQDGKWRDHDSNCRYWFSYEPYGHIVYHYGYWQWSVLWGWYWIPGHAWGPAWVNWYWYGNYAYWTPMWVDGFDNWYFRTHYDRYYSRSNSRFWNVVHKDQLKNPNLGRAINSAQQTLRATNPIQIASSQLKPNVAFNQNRANATASNSVKTFSSNASVNSPNHTTPSTNKQKYVGGLKDSPWSNDSRVQTNRSTSQSRSRIPIRISGLPLSGRSRFSPQSRSSNRAPVSRPSVSRPPASRSSVVRSSGASRSSAARTTSSRPASSRGTVARKK